MEIIHPEHNHTIAIKTLLTTFLGDDSFANLGKLETTEMPEQMRQAQELAKQKAATTNGNQQVNGHASSSRISKPDIKAPGKSAQSADGAAPTGEASKSKEQMDLDTVMEEPAYPPPPTRMTTRSRQQQEQQLQQLPPSPSKASPLLEVDPWFYPPNAHVDRDFGIPADEAEETRRLLLAAVQRQEEFMRGLNKVYHGLLEAKHRKEDVWRWCRSMEGVREHHATKTGRDINEITEEEMAAGMSDNEDWYDPSEWNLEGELVKGKEEEEEEQEKTKKTTRGRRT